MKKSQSAKSNSEKLSANVSKHDFLMVGIGASAGGIQALKTFFAAMPADSGMAFVVILHLSQTHESNLAEILQSQTRMRVEQVTKTVKVEPNNIYVIPPARHLAMVDGQIRLTEPERIKGRRVPIDLFFRTLADAYGKNGIAVVLSGTGSDGTLGLKRVKENGGIGIAQEPTEAEYDGMPRSAINTGLVDLILPVGEIPAKLVEMRDTGERIKLPKEKDEIPRPSKSKEPDALNEILAIVKVRTGHDFSNYKQATVLRRIARRLQVHGFAEMTKYLAYLREHHEEAEVLQRDLLITVTNFFRDKEAFEVLEKEIVPKLFAGKTAADMVRVWSVGCATGEEAYSLAILLDEYASRMTNAPKIQVFASDINERAIGAGRECFYEETIVADISPERLRHYFAKENGGYRVRKKLRETVLFAPHNILRDPPFSKLDLIVCRNLMIYFNRETQNKVLGIFNFALRSDGFLFLGAAESAESQSALFAIENKKHRIYRARPVAPHQTLPALPAPGGWSIKTAPTTIKQNDETPSAVSYGEIHYKLVEQFAPPSVLVNEDYDIVHVSENAGRFLRVTVGEPTRNLLKTVNPALKLDLQSALLEAKKDGFVGESRNIRFDSGLEHRTNLQSRIKNQKSKNPQSKIRNPKPAESLVNITVQLIHSADAAAGFYLVIFDESKSPATPARENQNALTVGGRNQIETMVRQLESELQISRERLRATIEQNETATEELKASNEELQAVNEEQRSTAEELETSKEELQSLNEELTTVNHELKDKVDETLHANSDLQNLIASTDIGTIFLDRALRVKRYTPRVSEIFNLIPSDVGRPLEHITHRLADDHLAEDAAEVLQSLHLKEREVRGGANDSRYLVRIAPYRTLEDKIDGVVLSFQNITDLKRASDALGVSEEKYRNLFDSIDEGFCIVEVLFDEQGKAFDYRFLEINPAFERQSGLENARGKTILELVPDLEPQWAQTYGQVARTGEAVRFEADVAAMNRVFDIYAFPANAPATVAVLFTDITERKHSEEKLRESEEIFRAFVTTSSEAVYWMNHDWSEMRRLHGKEFIADTNEPRRDWLHTYIHPDDQPLVLTMIREAVRTRSIFELEHRVVRVDGSFGWTFSRAIPLLDSNGEIVQWFGVASDITTRKRAEIALRESEERLRALIENLPGGAVFVVDKDLRYLIAEGEALADTGFKSEDLVGRTIGEAMPPELVADYETLYRRTLAGEAFEHEHTAHNRTFVSRGVPLKDAAGEIYAVLAVSYDITDRKQAEEDLWQSEERLRLAVEAGELGTWDWSLATNEVFWNERHFILFGMKPRPNPLSAEEFFNHIHPDDSERVRGQLEQAVEGKTIFQTEFRAVTDAGDVRWMGGYGQTVETDTSGKTARMSGVMFDVSELKRAEEVKREKETLQKMVGAQEDERRRIAQDLHDHLGQQLTALRLKIESIKIMCDDNEALCKRVEETQAIARQIDADIDFLSWQMRPTALDDIGLAAALANYVREWSNQFQIPADFQAGRFGKNRLAADAETHLYRIAQEALNNVYKHAQAKGVDVSLERRSGFAVLIVEDDGIGFLPGKVSGKKNQKSIGLAGMKERAALVGGKVEIESTPGVGTTVFVRIPIEDDKKPTKRKKKKDE